MPRLVINHEKIFFILALISTNTFGGDLYYNCIIKSASTLENNAKFPVSGYINSKFKVNKKLGLITGEIIENNTPYANKPIILSNGDDKSNNYKVLTTFGPNPSILYLEIMDLQMYANLKQKPFIGFRLIETFSGVCE